MEPFWDPKGGSPDTCGFLWMGQRRAHDKGHRYRKHPNGLFFLLLFLLGKGIAKWRRLASQSQGLHLATFSSETRLLAFYHWMPTLRFAVGRLGQLIR